MKKNDSLDLLLEQWAQRTEPSAEERRRLETRIRNAVNNPKTSKNPDEASECLSETGLRICPTDANPWRPLLAWAAVLLLLLGAGGLWHRLQVEEERMIAAHDQVEHLQMAQFTPAELGAHKLLLDELDSLFGGALRSVRIGNNDMNIDLRDDARAHTDAPVVLRTLMMVRRGKSDKWEQTWRSEVLLPVEEYVTVNLPQQKEGRIGLWVHRLPDGAFMVDSEIAGAAVTACSKQATGIFEAGEALQIFNAVTPQGECRVYQSLETLANGKG